MINFISKIYSVLGCFVVVLLSQCGTNNTIQNNSNQTGWDTVSASFYKTDSVHFGEATFYGIAAEGGNCGLPSPSPWDTLAGAMNYTDYRNSEVCGACVMVSGPEDSAVIRINDQCPECKEGDIDLTQQVFRMIGPLEAGRFSIRWHFVPCPVSGNAVLYFTPGSSMYYAGIQVRNHLTPIRAMEVQTDSVTWKEIVRKPYNRFELKALSQPPWILKVRDVFGEEIVDSAVPLLDGNEYEMKQQFSDQF